MSLLLSSRAVDLVTGMDLFPFFQLLGKSLHQEPKPVRSSVGLLGASWDDISSCQHLQYSFLPVLPSRHYCPVLLPLRVCLSGCAEGWRPLCVLGSVGEASKVMCPDGCRTDFLMVPCLVGFFMTSSPRVDTAMVYFHPFQTCFGSSLLASSLVLLEVV